MGWPDRYTRIRYAPCGRSWQGVDCWGLVYLVYRDERGIELPTYLPDYDSPGEHERLGALIDVERARDWTEPAEPAEFDVLVFNVPFKRRLWPCHVGIMVDPATGTFLQALKGAGVHRASLSGLGPWGRRLAGAHRLARC